jgi:hypothetical protein
MLPAQEEALSLRDEPLPQLIEYPLAQVYRYDREIAELTARISDLTARRTEALNFAIKQGIRIEGEFKVIEKTRAIRILDIDKFKATFPDKFSLICENQRADIAEGLEHVGEKIALGVVDKLVNKHALAASGVISVQEKITYEVMRV